MKVKFCGIRRMEDVDYVNKLLPDYIGFVFAKSKRQVTLEEAKMLREHLAEGILVVGVFVNPTISFIKELLEQKVIDMIQLHGDESEHFIEELKQNFPKIPVVKVHKITVHTEPSKKDEIKKALCIKLNEKSVADAFLFDSKVVNMEGGSGISFPYDVLPTKCHIPKPFFYAGGINKQNVREILHNITPDVLDISSGIETNGTKDFEKMKEILEMIKECEVR